MAKREIEIGDAGRAVAARLIARRRMLALTQGELSARVAELGRTLTPASIGEIERLARRVDIDDLVALCGALSLDLSDALQDVMPSGGATKYAAEDLARMRKFMNVWKDFDGNDQ